MLYVETNIDRHRINVDEDYDLRAWSEKFGGTSSALREVGPDAAAVEPYLNRKPGT